jgi:hypothetical protein
MRSALPQTRTRRPYRRSESEWKRPVSGIAGLLLLLAGVLLLLEQPRGCCAPGGTERWRWRVVAPLNSSG